MALIAGLIVMASVGLPDACMDRDGPPVDLTSSVEITPYLVKGRSIRRAARGMALERSGEPKKIGRFEYQWTSRFLINEAGRIERVCGKVSYHIAYPEFSERLACFSGLSDAVRAHEDRHLEITDTIIKDAFAAMIGWPAEQANAQLRHIDTYIDNANEAFHRSPEGQSVDLEAYMKAECLAPN